MFYLLFSLLYTQEVIVQVDNVPNSRDVVYHFQIDQFMLSGHQTSIYGEHYLIPLDASKPLAKKDSINTQERIFFLRNCYFSSSEVDYSYYDATVAINIIHPQNYTNKCIWYFNIETDPLSHYYIEIDLNQSGIKNYEAVQVLEPATNKYLKDINSTYLLVQEMIYGEKETDLLY